MSELIREPLLTKIIQELDMRGLDPIACLEVVPGGAIWREEDTGLTVEPTPPTPYDRDLSSRDKQILDSGGQDYDYVQIVFSRMTPRNDTMERDTAKTAHLPIEAVKQYLRRRSCKP